MSMLGAAAPSRSPGGHARRGEVRDHAGARALAAAIAAARATRGLWIACAIGGGARLIYGPGHLGYDAGWALLWGKQMAAGQLPAFQAPGAPTPHPLANAVAALVSPLGDAAGDVILGLSALCFGLLCWAAYVLGMRLFGRLAGVLFGAILFTRPAFVNSQAQALIDIPFVALVVAAAALEADRPRRGGAVVALLVLAGLLRPEGWLIMGAYVLYLLPACGTLRARVRVLCLAAIAPCVWAAFDFVVTGDPVYSLHGTQQLAAELDRPRSLGAALQSAPASLADVLGMPLTLAGLLGCVVAVLVLYQRALIPAALIGVGLTCFMALGIAGLPVLNRYLIVPVVMLGLFAAVALVGWHGLERADWRRAPWLAGSVLVCGLLALSVPADVHNVRTTASFLVQRHTIERDLYALTRAGAWTRRGGRPVHVTTRRAVPLLAAWLDLPPVTVSAVQPRAGARSLLIRHASPTVAANYYSLTTPAWSPVADPSVSWHELYRNGSWVLEESHPSGSAAPSGTRHP